ncbi:Ca2+-binding RTX toxin-like protein, partial [Rhizobium alvei]
MYIIEYDELSAGQYTDFRYQLMKTVWGDNKRGFVNPSDAPAIGTGFDMRTSVFDFKIIAQHVLGAAYDEVLAVEIYNLAINRAYSVGQDGQLRNRMNAVLEDWAAANPDYDGPLKFEFSTQAAIKATLADLGGSAESILSWADIDVPNSQERAVLFSLAFEGVDLDNILMAMIDSFNRVETWYLIRYESNDGEDSAEGIAIARRRYIQSDLFELYNDPDQISYEEARAVALSYSSHRSRILSYESSYAPGSVEKADAAGTSTISDHLQGAIGSILDNFGASAEGLEEVLYVRGTSPNIRGDGTNFDSAANDDDLLVGDRRDNRMLGEQGNDLLLGLAGNDDLLGAAGKDRLYGGDGNDTLTGGAGADHLFGETGNDTLTGDAGNDRILGGSGADKVDGSTGSDNLRGGAGNDELTAGEGNDTVFGDAGNDIILGGAGLNRLNGGDGDDTITGGNETDRISGGAGRDSLMGGLGDDQIDGGADADNIDASAGSDTVFGDAGNDIILGGAGLNRLDGGDGDDTITGGNETDRISGGAGRDSLMGGLG